MNDQGTPWSSSAVSVPSTSMGNYQCGHCGYIHGPICPRIKAIQYYPNGAVKRVEYNQEPSEPYRGTVTISQGTAT